MLKKTIFIAGDSTAATYPPEAFPLTGWGQALAEIVPNGFNVVNMARPGRSTKSFRDEGVWDELLSQVRSCDIVIIQFGHNDQKSDPALFSSEKQYEENLCRMIAEVRNKNAEPVLITSVCRCRYDENGKLLQTLGVYPDAMRRVASSEQVRLLDANRYTEEVITSLPKKEALTLFAYPSPGIGGFEKGTQDTSHFSPKGAKIVAEWILQKLQIN